MSAATDRRLDDLQHTAQVNDARLEVMETTAKASEQTFQAVLLQMQHRDERQQEIDERRDREAAKARQEAAENNATMMQMMQALSQTALGKQSGQSS